MRIAIIGAGPAGCIAAYFLQNNFDVTLFDFSSPLRTLLPTGGGRCNLAYCEYDFKDLAKNYPRGEKFLYSVLSKFSTADTIEFFENIGVKTYVQDDMRIFPESNSAKDVREKFLSAIKKTKIIKEKVLRVDGEQGKFNVVTDSTSREFDRVVVAVGGHAGYNIAKYLGHSIVEPKPALVGLKTKENFKELAGVALSINGEGMIFTHEGISGPLVYKISSINARKEFPYVLEFGICPDLDLQKLLNENPHKDIKNLLSDLVPKSLAVYILNKLKINSDEKCHKIDGKMRDLILGELNHFKATVVGTSKDGEVVTSGGVALNEVNPKTMESKLVQGIYFCGEVLDIDGFCGGFNLQNCWSTGYAVSEAIQSVRSQSVLP